MNVAEFVTSWKDTLDNQIKSSDFSRPYLILSVGGEYQGVYVKDGVMCTVRNKKRRIVKKVCKKGNGRLYPTSPISMSAHRGDGPFDVEVTFSFA